MHVSKSTTDRKRGERRITVGPADEQPNQTSSADGQFEPVETTRDEHMNNDHLANEELTDLFENATVGLHLVNADGVIVHANPAQLVLLGYAHDEYVGHQAREFHADPALADDLLERLSRGENIRDCRAQLRARDGSIRDVLITSSARFEKGQFINTRCFFIDISDRVKSERQLVARDMVTRALAESRTVDEAAPRILGVVCKQLDWQVGGLWSVDESANLLRCVHMFGSPRAPQFEVVSHEHSFAPGVGLPGRVWQSRKPVWIEDVAIDRNFPRKESATAEDLHAAFACPITLNDKVLGVMEFFSGEIRKSDPELLVMMDAVGSQMGQFMERWHAEEVLYQTQDQLRSELKDAKLLHEISAAMIQEHNVESLYERIVDAAMTIMQSQFASLQMLYTRFDDSGHTGELRLLAFRGFNPQAATFWEWVRPASRSTCGLALKSGTRVIASDVEKCDAMAGSDHAARFTRRRSGENDLDALERAPHADQARPAPARHSRAPSRGSDRAQAQ
jgi:PAS domain S-box-containing protein